MSDRKEYQASDLCELSGELSLGDSLLIWHQKSGIHFGAHIVTCKTLDNHLFLALEPNMLFKLSSEEDDD